MSSGKKEMVLLVIFVLIMTQIATSHSNMDDEDPGVMMLQQTNFGYEKNALDKPPVRGKIFLNVRKFKKMSVFYEVEIHNE